MPQKNWKNIWNAIIKIAAINFFAAFVVSFGAYPFLVGHTFIKASSNLAYKLLGDVVLIHPENQISTSVQGNTETEAQNAVVLPIFVYHSVSTHYNPKLQSDRKFSISPHGLEKELQYLKDNGFTSITFDALTKHWNEGTKKNEKPVILSFDDAWENHYTHALPLLKKYGFVATFFVFSSAPGHKNFLSWQELGELSNTGMEIGGHSKSHPYLSNITDEKELEREIMESKRIIESHLKKTITVFAYPFGNASKESTLIVEKAGYQAARTMVFGTRQLPEERFILRSVLGNENFAEFTHILDQAFPKNTK